MFFTFVRHMEVDWNRERRFTAQAFNLRLNSTGLAEAESMAVRLECIPFQMVVSSDQLRAVETALIIASRHPAVRGFVTDPRLREVHVGSLVGTRLADVTEPVFRTRHPQFDYRSLGGEHRAGVVIRHRASLDELKKSHFGQEALIVGHGTGLGALLEDLGITEILTRENFIRIEY